MLITVYLYPKDSYKSKYQFLIKKRKDVGKKSFYDFKACIAYCNDMDDICKNSEEYNSNRKHKVLIAFDNMIADMLSNKRN